LRARCRASPGKGQWRGLVDKRQLIETAAVALRAHAARLPIAALPVRGDRVMYVWRMSATRQKLQTMQERRAIA
jgi:hypothetical protein